MILIQMLEITKSKVRYLKKLLGGFFLSCFSVCHSIKLCVSHFFYYSYNVNAQERAKHLEEKMHAQFNKMHDFLREKEKEIMRQLQKAANSAEKSMQQNASLLTNLQINGNNQVSVLESGLTICQPEKFLQVIFCVHKYNTYITFSML